jgi:hypothetical protein
MGKTTSHDPRLGILLITCVLAFAASAAVHTANAHAAPSRAATCPAPLAATAPATQSTTFPAATQPNPDIRILGLTPRQFLGAAAAGIAALIIAAGFVIARIIKVSLR